MTWCGFPSASRMSPISSPISIKHWHSAVHRHARSWRRTASRQAPDERPPCLRAPASRQHEEAAKPDLKGGNRRQQLGAALGHAAERDAFGVNIRRETGHDISADAMIELRQAGILERIEPPGAKGKSPFGENPPVHVGPGVVKQPGMQPGNQRAQKHLDIDQRHHRKRPARLLSGVLQPAQIFQRNP